MKQRCPSDAGGDVYQGVCGVSGMAKRDFYGRSPNALEEGGGTPCI